MIADDYRVYFAFAADEQADLAINIAGKERHPPGQIRTDDIFRGNAFAVETLYLFDLCGPESCCISGNFIDSCLPVGGCFINAPSIAINLSYFIRISQKT